MSHGHFCEGNHQCLVDSLQKELIMLKTFPCHDGILCQWWLQITDQEVLELGFVMHVEVLQRFPVDQTFSSNAG